uniref:SEC-C domain-containing protein n=1 Tax=Janibacter limosus TaxID=53458 RepID=A0AC61U373_9MICO
MDPDPCPCGSGRALGTCCGPLLAAERRGRDRRGAHAQPVHRARLRQRRAPVAHPGTAGPGRPRYTSTTPDGSARRSARPSTEGPRTARASSTSSLGTPMASSPSAASSPVAVAAGSTRRRSDDRGPVRRHRPHRDDHARRPRAPQRAVRRDVPRADRRRPHRRGR